MNFEHISEITVHTIRMLPQSIQANNSNKRKPLIAGILTENLICHESFLRKLAYKNTTIKTDESFFDDSDMNTRYSLVVVYHNNSDTPLLSARYYFNKPLIAKILKGDNGDTNQADSRENLNLDNFKDDELFLADRLSGNIYSAIYRKNRAHVFSLFYSEILTYNKNCKLILMARKEKQDKLLKKYLRLGFKIIGSTIHKGREHWIVITDLK